MTTDFRALHVPGDPLLLANAWDVASARIVAAAGARAIATTSAGAAWSLGYPDGDAIDRDTALDLVRRVTAAVDVPVTADIEGGYSPKPTDLVETAAAVVDAGAVGVNFEDCVYDEPAALLPVEQQAERIAALRTGGGDLFINARTDVYLRGVGDPAARLDETLRRAAAYLAAGADGVFVPGVTDLETVRDLTASIDAPVNILAGPGAPPVSALADAGVARISLGSSIAAAAYAVADRAAHELFGPGTYDALADGLDYPTLNTLLS
ncbi:MAG TPA: isocitrate lyase/phosphoenolpyruvate mutase family protein [Kribbellaceae bacterium]|nr:isocitrate lyase/phosphoenolpyruvate mutase family protein [Kribbellaceae bacterium]